MGISKLQSQRYKFLKKQNVIPKFHYNNLNNSNKDYPMIIFCRPTMERYFSKFCLDSTGVV